jgi:ParB family transcriptional regulator, chromosome partitioning protein
MNGPSSLGELVPVVPMEDQMQLATVPFSALLPPKGNPRRTFDNGQIASLACSIKADGVLQNMVVRPEAEGCYRVVFGKRRYLALQLLKKEGAIDESYPVPVEIKEGLSDAEALRLATVENVQREQLNPADEAEAFAKLLQHGGTFEAIAEKTGLSPQTVKRRVALAALCGEAKKALRLGSITRSVAEALTLGSHVQQRLVLETLEAEDAPDAEEIREHFLRQKPNVAMATFPAELYTGTYATDLFSDEETTYFDDVDQFLTLQKAAVERLAEEYRAKAAWVEVLNLYTVPWWQYRQAEGDEPAGVVINLHPGGSVEVREGLARHEVKEEVVASVRQTPLASQVRERPALSVELIRYVVKHKSAAVQAALLRNYRKAKEMATLLLLLGARYDGRVRLSPHSSLSLMSEPVRQRACQEIEAIAAGLAGALGLQPAAENGREPVDGLSRLLTGGAAHDLYEALGQLSDEELDRLMILLPLLCFGQQNPDVLDADDSLFNRIAVELGLNMREWWVPDATFLSSLRREQLLMVALECGAMSRIQGLTSRSKTEAVAELAQHFVAASLPDAPDDDVTRAANQWLPGLFKFPAAGGLASGG